MRQSLEVMHGGLVSSRSRIRACDRLLRATEAFQGLVPMGMHLVEFPLGKYPHSHQRYPTGSPRSANNVNVHPGPSTVVLSAIVQSPVGEAREPRVIHTDYWMVEDCENSRRIGI